MLHKCTWASTAHVDYVLRVLSIIPRLSAKALLYICMTWHYYCYSTTQHRTPLSLSVYAPTGFHLIQDGSRSLASDRQTILAELKRQQKTATLVHRIHQQNRKSIWRITKCQQPKGKYASLNNFIRHIICIHWAAVRFLSLSLVLSHTAYPVLHIYPKERCALVASANSKF